jgi:acyl-CoA thioester hydrolase
MPASSTRVRVRYAETDQMGVVYHGHYFVWFEIGRVELLRQSGFDYKQMELADGCHIVVVEAACRYRSPARYDDELLVETRVAAVRQSALKSAYRILRLEPGADSAPKLLAEGETTHVVVDGQMTRALLPEKYLAALRG